MIKHCNDAVAHMLHSAFKVLHGIGKDWAGEAASHNLAVQVSMVCCIARGALDAAKIMPCSLGASQSSGQRLQ